MKDNRMADSKLVIGVCLIIYGIAFCAYGLNRMVGLGFSYFEILVFTLVWVVASMGVSAYRRYADYEGYLINEGRRRYDK